MHVVRCQHSNRRRLCVCVCICLSIRGSHNQSGNRSRSLKFWSSFGLIMIWAMKINQNRSTGTGPSSGFLSHRMMGLTLLVWVDGTSSLWRAVSSVMCALSSKKELRINNIIEHNNNNEVIKELKQKVLTKTQRFSGYGKRQNKYCQNKMFRTYCKEFCKLLKTGKYHCKKYTN